MPGTFADTVAARHAALVDASTATPQPDQTPTVEAAPDPQPTPTADPPAVADFPVQ